MIGVMVLSEQATLNIPPGINSLEDFRRWSQSSRFPAIGRIDLVQGQIEVDMAAEKFYSHGGPKTEIASVLQQIVKREELGEVRIDSTRIVCVDANLSCEPDVVFISYESFDTGAVRLTGKSGDDEDGIEVEGSPDLVIEIVSDSSVDKDTGRLPKAYFQAGVREFWLVDARGDELVFKIQTRGRAAFRSVVADAEGYLRSRVFDRRFRLARHQNSRGNWVYDLIVRST